MEMKNAYLPDFILFNIFFRMDILDVPKFAAFVQHFRANGAFHLVATDPLFPLAHQVVPVLVRDEELTSRTLTTFPLMRCELLPHPPVAFYAKVFPVGCCSCLFIIFRLNKVKLPILLLLPTSTYFILVL